MGGPLIDVRDPATQPSEPPAAPPPEDIIREAARLQGSWILGPAVRSGLLVLLAALVAVLLVRPAPRATAPGDFRAIATSISTLMAEQKGVTVSSAGYLPGTGIVVVTSLKGIQPGQLNGALAAAIAPFVAQLAELPDGEALSWQATLTGISTADSTWLVRVPPDQLLDQARWTSVAPPAAPTSAAITPAATTPATATGSTSAAGSATTNANASPVTAPATPLPSAASGDSAGSVTAPAVAPLSDDFSGTAGGWKAIAGTWQIKDGSYQQTDNSGFDYISQFTSVMPATFSVSVTMKGLADSINGGVLIGQPKLGARQGATIVDLSGKDYIRWGSYDTVSGTYKFIGGVSLGGAPVPTDAHTLAISVAAGGTVVSWDGAKVGSFAAVSPGFVGLVTTQSAVAFDDFTVTPS